MPNDPYKILGIPENSSEDEVKLAYRTQVQRYMNSERKLAELNSAYDAIMNKRRGNTTNNGYIEVRSLIKQNRYDEADKLLTGLDSSTAEWNFLMGTVYYSKGWLNDAYMYFNKAKELDPSNAEYSKAFKHMNDRKNGYMNGSGEDNNSSGSQGSQCGVCTVCQGLICADCCCECMGADCIPCC